MTAERMAGRVALVTGSSSGIGAGIARAFAREGAAVVVTGLEADLADDVAARLRRDGGRATSFVADLGDPDQGRDLVAFAVQSFGAIDTLVNNAGDPTSARATDGPLEKTDVDYWDHMYRVNVRSALVVTKAALPHLRASGHGGRVIFTSSVMALRGGGWDIYSWTKAALLGLTRSMATSYAGDRITVNAIAVGSVVVEKTAAEWEREENDRFWRRTGLTRVGEPDDIARCCLWLGSNEGEYVTGSVISVDGGMAARAW